ncbi:hypothetical protein PFFCH_01230 [Plasmodium falciparum FCH/4]|uniref:Uncharacterized protein n=1 Tax=Plasmodium falciparum FCH/4 TaxID=1036724 RepID=A0A024VSY1_PLAFA|nr:hypothetical protein PFFCH_01230 [Plasmodium falciparum FCH/4]
MSKILKAEYDSSKINRSKILINKNKFYVNIIKKSEKIYKCYENVIKEEKRKKRVFEKIKQKYLFRKKKQDLINYVHSPPNDIDTNVNKKRDTISKEEFNPFFNFFENDKNKNIYHSNINFTMKTHIQFNKYFYKLIINKLSYYKIKKDLYVNIVNIVNEITKNSSVSNHFSSLCINEREAIIEKSKAILKRKNYKKENIHFNIKRQDASPKVLMKYEINQNGKKNKKKPVHVHKFFL